MRALVNGGAGSAPRPPTGAVRVAAARIQSNGR
jgi:hypothetical protein